MTCICADHWERGEKLGHTHLPALFPWSVSKAERRSIKKFDRDVMNQFTRKRKVKDDDDEVINEIEIESTDCNTSKEENYLNIDIKVQNTD